MKDGFKDIVGRQIAAVVVAANEKRPPRNQVFLVFTDGTCLELYGEAFTCCGGLDKAEAIESYVRSSNSKIARVYGEAQLESVAAAAASTRGLQSDTQPATLMELMGRDLAAWNAAKAVIAKARR